MAAASEWFPWREVIPSVVFLSLAGAAVLFGTAQERGWFVRLWRLVFGRNRETVAQEEASAEM